MGSVALDADVVIAFLDRRDEQHERAVESLRPWLAEGANVIIGATVYAEIMVRPLRIRADAAVDEFLGAINSTVIPVDRRVARRAAELRARHPSLRLPDALSLATAVLSGAELLTLDQRLKRIAARELPAP